MEYFVADNVSKFYNAHVALDNVSIKVEEKSIFGLLGPNGAGKTSLIRIINQITGPDTGQLYIKGESLAPKHTAIIGYLPEERGLYKKMKVGEQALYLAQLKGLSRTDAIKSLKYWFEKFDIHNWWNRRVEELSKGMQQKVQFIVTIIHKPQFLIFDEPFSGFDPINTALLKEEILELKKNGATIIFSTHNMASVEELCDDIALINQSHVILSGNVKDIKEKFKDNRYFFRIKGLKNELQMILPEGSKILEITKHNGTTECNVQLPAVYSPNQLIQSILNEGELTAFTEILPTMNEIFIQKVNETNKTSSKK